MTPTQLKIIMLQKGFLTHQQLADAVPCYREEVTMILNGTRQTEHLKKRIEEILDVNLDNYIQNKQGAAA